MGRPVKRSINIAGHATSISLEAPFWDCLRDIASERGLSLNQLIAEIDKGREGGLSSAIRLFVLEDLQARVRTVEDEAPN